MFKNNSDARKKISLLLNSVELELANCLLSPNNWMHRWMDRWTDGQMDRMNILI
jgi:hypothetical protein